LARWSKKVAASVSSSTLALRSFIERIERLEEERASLSSDSRRIYSQ
jgi:uncharacterized protein (UPF0335 family)